jgi:hypothetical protein
MNMKKLLSLLLITTLLVSLCACSVLETDDNEPQTNQSQKTETTTATTTQQTAQTTVPPKTTTEPITVTTQPQEEVFEEFDMPEPFEHTGGDGNHDFYMSYNTRMIYSGGVSDDFIQYAASSQNKSIDEIVDMLLEKFPNDRDFIVELKQATGLMDYPNLFYRIVELNVPNEVVIRAIEESNTWYRGRGHLQNVYTDEEIAALLTRDEAIITAQFAEETAIIIGDRAFSPVWIYYNSLNDIRAEGITPQMIQEKLPLYAEFPFTADATAAFENKLSAFTRQEVSFAEIASDVSLSQSRS